MAKYNLFLGTATNSVGDVTLMRRNGVQVARARVRKIANPRSEGQARQRMIAAAATRFFSPLASVLETSWQGMNRSNSYSAYLKAAFTRGRELEFAVPKAAGWYPVPVQLSQGTMPSPVVVWNTESDEGFAFKVSNATEGVTNTIASISEGLIDLYGLQEGDQVTLIAGASGQYSAERPVWMRFNVDLNDITPISLAGFDVTIDTSLAGGSYLNFGADIDLCTGLGVIFSRWDGSKWLRSTSIFKCSSVVSESDYFGDVAFARYLPEWMASESNLPVSDVYLNNAKAVYNVVVTNNLSSGVGTLTINGQSVAWGTPFEVVVGTQVTIAAAPASGYTLSGLVYDNLLVGSPLTITVNENISIEARFVAS